MGVKCLAQEQNRVSLATRIRTWTAHSGTRIKELALIQQLKTVPASMTPSGLTFSGGVIELNSELLDRGIVNGGNLL